MQGQIPGMMTSDKLSAVSPTSSCAVRIVEESESSSLALGAAGLGTGSGVTWLLFKSFSHKGRVRLKSKLLSSDSSCAKIKLT